MSFRWTYVMGGVTGWAQEKARILKELNNVRYQVKRELEDTAHIVHKTLTDNTPVHTGEALRNWRWSLRKRVGGRKLKGLGSGPPGATNKMPMGAEPRRGPNLVDVNSRFQTVLEAARGEKDPSSMVVTSLLDPEKFDLVDNGRAPTPGLARNPGGITKLAMQAVRSRRKWKPI